MRRLALLVVVSSLIMIPLIGIAGCDTCDVCGTYYRELQAGETEDYIRIHSDGACEWPPGDITSGAGTWELHEEETATGFPPLRTIAVRDPGWGTVISYTLLDDVLVAPNGARYKKDA